MHVAVVELLRCPAGHTESALVAAASRQIERRILQGTLGCPVCSASYPINSGVADFRDAGVAAHAELERETPNEETALRLAAQLDLTEAGRLVLLFGAYARLAPALSVMFDALCIAVNATPEAEAHIAEHATVLRVARVLPLARGSLQGAAVDATHSATAELEQVQGLLRPRGRLVAPAGAEPPTGLEVLARDAMEWVAARAADVVPLRRASR